MPTGRLFTYNAAKGYGVITHGNNEKDVFAHASELAKAGIELSANTSLAGLVLQYEIGLGKNNKKQALKIKVIDNRKVCGNHSPKEATPDQIIL